MPQLQPYYHLLPLAIPLLFAALIAIGFFVYLRYERRRREEIERLAPELGLSYEKEGRPFPDEETAGLHLFGEGHSKAWSNLLRGSLDGMQALVFDYRYTIGGGKNSSTHRQTAAAFPLSRPLPAFEMRPETFLHKIGQAFGYRDMDFDSHPGFSKQYLLRGADENALRSAFHSGILGFFESSPGWSVESNGRWLIVYKGNARAEPAKLREFAQEARRIAGLFAGR